jgi:hypothetical protein
MEYRNLDLEAFDYEAADDVERFRVRVTGSPAGEQRYADAEQVTILPDLRKQLRQLERRGMRLPEMIALGEDLASLLFPPRARLFLVLSRERIDWDEGLRIRLRMHTYALADLPWEYAYVAPPDTPPSQKGADGFLVLDRQVSLVRYEVMGQSPGSLDPVGVGPLRLVALLADPSVPGYPHLNLDAERQNIEQALDGLSGIGVEFYPDATVETLEDALTREAHVFHFAGHGEFEGDLGVSGSLVGTGHLVLLDDRGGPYLFPAEKLAQNLRGRGVRLAVLGTCEGGRRDQVNAWTGVVTALTRAGIPAVVGMQYTIRDTNAIAFSRRFYRALAAGQPIDAAVTDGRLAIFNRSGDDERDWGVPVLYLRSDAGVLFPRSRPRVWLYMADGEEERQMDLLERQDRVLWGANRHTRAGDIVLMYRTAPHSDVAYLFRAEGDAREAEQTATWRWDYAVDLGEKVTLGRPLRLAEIWAHPDLAEWGLARTLQGAMRRRTDIREEGYWEALRGLLVAWNPALAEPLAEWEGLEPESLLAEATTAAEAIVDEESRARALSGIAQAQKAQWTVLVYMAANNDLDGLAAQDLAQILEAGSTPQVNLLVLCDRPDGASRYVVGKSGAEAVEESLDNFNSGSPDALLDTMRWAVEQWPAERYGLVLWRHGSTRASEQTERT